MLLTELLELIRNGENSGVEFKRDDVRPDSLATEISALINLSGGHILLGVEDDGSVTGLTRTAAEAEGWVMNLCRQNVQPALIPYWETLAAEEHKIVGVLTMPQDAFDKPYKAKRGQAWTTFVRVGSTSREATREEEARLYQAAGLLRQDVKAVPGSSLADLDMRRIRNYLTDVLHLPTPADEEATTTTLVNLDLLVSDGGRISATVGGLLLFGLQPNRYLPQAGITATSFNGVAKDYGTSDEELIRGPLVSLRSADGDVVEPGVIDRALAFVERNMGSTALLRGAERVVLHAFPREAIREAIVNAVAHRDYTVFVTDIELSLFEDRLEVISPGALPNTVTVEKMKQGYRAARNELVKEVLRDYGYVEHLGMGVRYKLMEGMQRHNNTETELLVDGDRLTVRLFKRPRE